MSGKESAPRGESVLKLFCPAVGNDIITGRVYCAILSFRINSTFFLKKKKSRDDFDHAISYEKGEILVSVFLILATAPGTCIQGDLNSCHESIYLMG